MSEEVEEHGIRINIKGTFHAPKKNEVMYNSEMVVNRSLVLCALAAYYESGLCTNSQVRCLDALGATGVSGLAWAKHFPKVDVVINDQSPAATERITSNAATNNLQVNITSEDVSVLLHQRPFDFVAAAKSNKGVEVVCCVALKSFITVMVRVLRGPAAANTCVRKIRRVIHCCVCEDRAFYPETVYPLEEPYSLLSCDCRSKSAGKLAVELGPVWCDEIFDANFCQAMLTQANNLQLSHKVISLLQTIVSEGKCKGEPGPDESVGGDKENTVSGMAEHTSAQTEKEEDDEEGEEEEKEGSQHQPCHSLEEDNDGERSPKRMKMDHPRLKSPAFYFNLHRHSPKVTADKVKPAVLSHLSHIVQAMTWARSTGWWTTCSGHTTRPAAPTLTLRPSALTAPSGNSPDSCWSFLRHKTESLTHGSCCMYFSFAAFSHVNSNLAHKLDK
ncbi:TRMT1-like protein isoform X3 [Scylla paramamosain]|uniref:TRMT1-like protein isoform X3 n=1 Tax=Scylla paramamosain TaxID=85552 RepID=UPI003083033A